MPYEVAWNIPGKVLRLDLAGDVSPAEFIEIDALILNTLGEGTGDIVLIVNALKVVIFPYSVEVIRASQTYLQSERIQHILVVTTNKVTRLTLLLIFSIPDAGLQFFDSVDQAQTFARVARVMKSTGKRF